MAKQTNFIRTQVRLPKVVNQSLENFAEKHGFSKNEAMIYLISKGVEIDAPSKEGGLNPFLGLFQAQMRGQ